MDVSRLFHLKAVKNFLSWLLKRKQAWYCKIYGHEFKVSVDKPFSDPVLHHTFYCGRCRTIFGYHDFPYMMYYIKGVNPQYGQSINKWLTDCGLSGRPLEKLIENLQKFRTRSTKPDIIAKRQSHDDHITGKKEGNGAILRIK